MTKKVQRRPAPHMTTVGWRETIGLPDLGISALRAKIDTGARTSALHAVDLEVYEKNGQPWVEFHVPQKGTPRSVRCSKRILDDRPIKNTSGVAEHRYIVGTTLVLGRRHWRMEMSLADRENMEFDLILGRTALRGRRLLINPGSSFLAGPPIDLSDINHPSREDGTRGGALESPDAMEIRTCHPVHYNTGEEE